MNKKLMAVAVAGALAAPMTALAQTSTVQIYGLINIEYGLVDNPDQAAGRGRSNTDTLNAGASRIGFRGEEQLGGGLSAWFQCETDIRFLGGGSQTNGNWCDRNSALGMKGAFGNVYVGTWDAPLKRVATAVRLTNETGWTGTQFMQLSNGGAWTGTFSTRNVHSVNYDTPNFGGFAGAFHYTTLQAARGAAGNAAGLGASATVPAGLGNVTPTPKGRIMAANVTYSGGPLYVGLAYQRHDDDRSGGVANNGCNGCKDDAWLIGGTYTFGPVKLGVMYIDAQIETNTVPTQAAYPLVATPAGTAAAAVTAGTPVTYIWPGAPAQRRERKAWAIAGDWNIAGPHTLRAGFNWADDIKRTNLTAACAAPTATNCPGQADDGAKAWQIGYIYSFSKRTTLGIAYMRVNNDSAGTYALTSNSTSNNTTLGTGTAATGTVRAGDDSGVFNLQMIHTF